MPPDLTDDGLRAAIAIRRSLPGTGVLVLSQHLAERYALRAARRRRAGRRLPAQGPRRRPRRLPRRGPQGRRRRDGAGPRGGRADDGPPAPRRPARGPHAARARCARADGRGPLQPRDRRRACTSARPPSRSTSRASSRSSSSATTAPTTGACSRSSRLLKALMSGERRARTRRARAGGAVERQRAAERGDAVREPVQPAAAQRVRSPAPVVGDLDHERVRVAATSTVAAAAPRVLGDVGQRLGDQEVGRGLDVGAEAAVLELERAPAARRPAVRSSSAAASPWSVSTGGWMPGGELAQVADRAAGLLGRGVERRRGRGAARLLDPHAAPARAAAARRRGGRARSAGAPRPRR